MEENNLKRANLIIRDKEYRDCLAEIAKREKTRIFCRHNMEHFLQVARIAYIRDLEENLGISKEMVYCASLLHDVGRHIQYDGGEKHDKASARIADGILSRTGFSDVEREQITRAIACHRKGPETADAPALCHLLYESDKASRNCFACEARGECDWEEKKHRKNDSIIW